MYLLYLLFIVLFIVYAGPCMEASKEAVSVFLFSVLPSLLPFFIVSKLLLDSPFTGKMSRLMGSVMEPVFGVPGAGAAALVPGILCGYPVGAAACADLYGLGLLEKAEAERLSAFSSNAGPFFVVGAVGAAMGRSPGAGVVLLATHIAAGLTVGFFFRYYKASARNFSVKRIKPAPDPRPMQGNRKQDARKCHRKRSCLWQETCNSSLEIRKRCTISRRFHSDFCHNHSNPPQKRAYLQK